MTIGIVESVSGASAIQFEIKELILELRADIREVSAKLEQKASRDDMHTLRNDVAAIKLGMASRENFIGDTREQLKELRDDVDALESFRSKLIGVSTLGALGAGFIAALLVWAITHGT